MDIPAQVEEPVFLKDPYAHMRILPLHNDYLRRTNSFDASYIYNELGHGINVVSRQCQSEPDLSKYGLFVEPEVIVEYEPYEPAPLVLSNPMYDGLCPSGPRRLLTRKRKLKTESKQNISEKFQSLPNAEITLVLLKKQLLERRLREEIDKAAHNRLLRGMEMEILKRKYEHNETIRKLELEKFS